MLWKRALIALIITLIALPTLAQAPDPNAPTVLDIFYDDVVDDTITTEAFWDWWTIDANAGDVIVIDMAASGGLQPLLGILDPGGLLVTQSENGEVDSPITLEYTATATGKYTIVATRVDNADGTSTGAYTLRVRRANSPVTTVDNSQDVTWLCETAEITTASTIRFTDDPKDALYYRITVYGVDGFRPVIRVNFTVPGQDAYEICNTYAEQTVDDVFNLPGEDAHTITADTLTSASQLALQGSAQTPVDFITLTIGSADGAPGRYMAIIEGFSIDPKDDVDSVEVGIGPLAALNSTVQVYMVGATNSRLDPYMVNPSLDQECDDAGRGSCDGVPAFTRAGATLHEGEVISKVIGDRSDAGLLLAPGTTDFTGIELGSRSGDTYGDYALVFIGSLPPRS